VIKALMQRANTILIGGAMANTFWKAMGTPVGASKVEEDKLDLARDLLEHAKKVGVKFLLPVDAVEADEFKAGARKRNTGRSTKATASRMAWLALDAGPPRLRSSEKEIGRREDDPLERPAWRLRDAGFCGRHIRDRRSTREIERHHDHRRRRFRDRGESNQASPTR
jgi:hypothetical protein